MRKTMAVLALLAGICYSCEKNEDPKYSGEFILSSEKLLSDQLYSYYGFTFEDGKVSVYSAGTSIVADLYAIFNDFNEEVTLQSSNVVDAFYKNGDFQSAGEAESFYNGYAEVTATGFQAQASDVKANQVWTVQTAGKKFAKIWIRDVQQRAGSLDNYVEITIRYHYQPDGSRTFPG
jgi:hypothetical protein